MEMSIYLTNLGKYNEGELVGEWVALPVSDDDLEQVLERIGIDGERYEETFITDYECNIPGVEISEYSSIEELNEIAEELEGYGEEEAEVIAAALPYGYTLEEACEVIDNGDYRIYDALNMSEVAEIVVDECGYLEGVPENVARYFDYEAFGRDLEIEGSFINSDSGIIELIR